MMGATPTRWKVANLSQVADIGSGVTKGRRLSVRAVELPYLRVANVQAGRLDLADLRTIQIEPDEIDRYRLERGDVVLTEGGDPDKLGRGAIWDGSVEPCVHQNHIFRVRCHREVVVPEYFAAYLQGYPARAYFLRAAKQTTGIASINKSQLSALPVLLPPLAEQRRIAAILDEADVLRRKRRESLALLDDLLRATFLDMFGDVAAKRSRWPFGTCRSATAMGSGKSPKDVVSRTPTDVPIYGGNGVNGYATTALFTEQVIVVGRVGQQCGITHLTSGQSWVTDNAIVVRVTNDASLDPVYLATAFQHAPIRDTVTRLDLPFINQDMLKDQSIPLPPIEEQRRFRRIRDSILEQLRRADDAASAADTLFASLLDQNFNRPM